ncbi:MAG: hypothetical protein H6Q53_549, partial [Deltaproteobacteria bacterium]|nr:hypothetical protein [Deltaproteobacteria bacterium]
PFLKSSTISDFDLTFSDLKGKTRFLPLPAELLEIKRGAITYNKQTIFVEELMIENLKSGKPFLFSLKAQNDTFFKNISISGEGLYKGKSSEVKGNMHIAGLDLARLSSKLKGVAVVQGPFTFAKQSFSFEGPFEMSGFELRDRVLEKPLSISRYTGKASVTYADDLADIKVENISFLNTTFFLTLKVDKDDLTSLDLSSGYIDLKEVKNYISLEHLAKGSGKLWEAIQEGRVKITKLHHEKKKPINADLELKDMGFIYKDMNFSKVEGLLNIDSYKVSISKGRGTFKSSHFTDAAGVVSLAKDKQAKVKGNYAVNLRDIPSMLDVGAVKFKHGTTHGTMELDGNKETGYRISGAGKIDDADVSWQKISASARGSYRFTDDEITFDPLIIKKGGTDMVIRGKWGKKSLGIFMKGSLDVDQIKRYVTLPFPANGVALLDMAIQNDDKVLTVNGDVVMDDISFTIPKFMKKDKGIRSAAHISASVKDKQVDIGHFSYNLDIIRVNGKGVISPDKTMNLDIGLNVQALERVAPLFFFDTDTPKGDLDLNIAFRGMKWPLRKIPSMRGYVKVNNGFIKLPWLPKPLKEINLNAEFKGDSSEILIKRIVCGQTTVGNSKLRIEGLQNPRFSLSAVMDAFDHSDFKDDSEFTLRSIKQDSLVARVSGDFSLQAGTINLPNMSGTELNVNGILRNRKLSVSQLTANILGGYADVQGAVDFSDLVPKLSIQGKVKSMTGGHLLKALGAKASMIEGEGAVAGNLIFEGENASEMQGSLHGNVSMYSRNGTIRKWNLLAKVFSLLNLYDLFRGKVQFTETGLQYSKMGAYFNIKEGNFTTNNFLIDSPSMLITGKGSVNGKDKDVNGTITVSPLVTIDKTINKIPVLRRIFRSKDKGFVYASYNLKGNIEDPDISLNYVETIGGRTVDTLKNILTLPVELFEKK